MEVQKERTDLLLGDLIRAASSEVRELSDGADVATVSPFGHAGKMQIIGEPLANVFREGLSEWIRWTMVVRISNVVFPFQEELMSSSRRPAAPERMLQANPNPINQFNANRPAGPAANLNQALRRIG